MFSLNLYKSGYDGTHCYIRKNGSGVAYATVPSASGFYHGSASTILYLNRGDMVDVGDCYKPENIDSFTSFIGFLLKAD